MEAVSIKAEVLNENGEIVELAILSGPSGFKVVIENPNGRREMALSLKEVEAIRLLLEYFSPAYKPQASR